MEPLYIPHMVKSTLNIQDLAQQNLSSISTSGRHYPIPTKKPTEPQQPYCYLSRETSEGYGATEDNLGYAGLRYGRLTAIARSTFPDKIEDYLPGITQRRPAGRKPWPRWHDRDTGMHNFLDQKLFAGWHPLALIAVAQYRLFCLDSSDAHWRGNETAAVVAVLRQLDYMYQKGRFNFMQPLSTLVATERRSIEYGYYRASMRHRFVPKNLVAMPPARLCDFANDLNYYEREMEKPHQGIPWLADEDVIAGYIEKAMAILPQRHPLNFAPVLMNDPAFGHVTLGDIYINNPWPTGPRRTRRGSSMSSEDVDIRSIPRVAARIKLRDSERVDGTELPTATNETAGMTITAPKTQQTEANTERTYPSENRRCLSPKIETVAELAKDGCLTSNVVQVITSSNDLTSSLTTKNTSVVPLLSKHHDNEDTKYSATPLPMKYSLQILSPVHEQNFTAFKLSPLAYQAASQNPIVPTSPQHSTVAQHQPADYAVKKPSREVSDREQSLRSRQRDSLLSLADLGKNLLSTPIMFIADTQYDTNNKMLSSKDQPHSIIVTNGVPSAASPNPTDIRLSTGRSEHSSEHPTTESNGIHSIRSSLRASNRPLSSTNDSTTAVQDPREHLSLSRLPCPKTLNNDSPGNSRETSQQFLPIISSNSIQQTSSILLSLDAARTRHRIRPLSSTLAAPGGTSIRKLPLPAGGWPILTLDVRQKLIYDVHALTLRSSTL